MTDAERVWTAVCAAWERLCGVLEDARFERRPGYVWTVCPPVPVPAFNGAWPEDDSAAPALAGALGEIDALDLPHSIQVRRGRTPACETEAERLGLMLEAETPAMIVRPDELHGVDVPNLRILRATTPDALAQALATAADAFGAPPELFTALYGLEVTELEGLVVYLGRAGEEDVSTAIGYTVEGTTGIFNVATPSAHRGRGYGAALTTCAVREGFAAGAEFGWLQSSEIGHSVYRRLGFRTVDTYLLYAPPEAPFAEL
ncbi:MAG TPA: GNAT family N-acetyltransferase [Gaiellaceae bacterium]|nr:GNAT family N-acetyltransferase [Gaiellaceae bacterium]